MTECTDCIHKKICSLKPAAERMERLLNRALYNTSDGHVIPVMHDITLIMKDTEHSLGLLVKCKEFLVDNHTKY